MGNTSQSQDRQRWDANLKADTARKILAGEASFEEMQRKLKVQPYQLLAWIGQHALEKREAVGAQTHDDTQTIVKSVAKAAITGERPSEDELRRMIAWCLKKYIVSE